MVTEAQRKALTLLGKTSHRRILLYGGARSGKTFAICLYLILRMLAFPGARELIARQRTIHAVSSVWRQTLLPLLSELFGEPGSGVYDINWSEHVITMYNGSELWLGGLDDKQRTEKLLGQEYLDIYLNEISQIGYDAVQIVLTRLAQRIGYAVNKGLFDCNPPSPQHWGHRMFMERVEPRQRTPYRDPERFAAMMLNPEDNRENLPADFIMELDDLPDAMRRRMKFGEWVKPEGAIYDIADADIISEQEVPPLYDFTVGVDFGLNGAAVLIGWDSDDVYVLDDVGGYNLTAAQLNGLIVEMTSTNWTLLGYADGEDDEGEYWQHVRYSSAGKLTEKWRSPPPMSYVAYCDPAGGERIQEISFGVKANNSVDPGIEWVQTKLQRGEYKIVRRATGVMSEVFDYRRDENGKVVKENDHYCDAKRYGTFSRASLPRPRVRRV